jgi:hypothetical protein
VVEQPGLLEALTELIASAIRGDPQAALLWVSRSQRHLAGQLAGRDYRVDHTAVGRLLRDMGFSLQANAETRGQPASRSQCPIRAYQCTCRPLPTDRPAGDLGRYQEKGADWRLQERRP